jgi:rubrerythrin
MRLMGLGGALVLLPGVLASCSDSDYLTAPASGDTVTIDFAGGDVAVLQLAFALEQLEADFYTRVVDSFGSSNIPAAEQTVLARVRNHEVIHRDFLGTVLGADGGFALTTIYRGVNFRDRASVLATATTLEDLGVAAYNGAALRLTSVDNLLVAAKIASVEARHASAIRDLLRPKDGSLNGFAPAAFDEAFSPTKAAAAAQQFVVEVLALANVPANDVDGQAPSDVLDALQLALLLEHLQGELYARGVAATGLIPAEDLAVFTTLRSHENDHVVALEALITQRGATPAALPAFDFTARGSVKDATGTSFDFLPTQYALFTMLAQAFEDTGVRAYKGQLGRLIDDKAVLGQALTIHSVEARHASEVRRLRGQKGWITNGSRDDLPAFAQPIYDGEENTTQAGIGLTGISGNFGGAAGASEAFDEPLTKQQVTEIFTPFLA